MSPAPVCICLSRYVRGTVCRFESATAHTRRGRRVQSKPPPVGSDPQDPYSVKSTWAGAYRTCFSLTNRWVCYAQTYGAVMHRGSDHLKPVRFLTLYPHRGFRRALSPRRVPSARPLRLAPWASGVAPGLIRTARARATIVQESAKCENTDVCISWRPFLALERSSEKAFKNAKHGSQLLRSSS